MALAVPTHRRHSTAARSGTALAAAVANLNKMALYENATGTNVVRSSLKLKEVGVLLGVVVEVVDR